MFIQREKIGSSYVGTFDFTDGAPGSRVEITNSKGALIGTCIAGGKITGIPQGSGYIIRTFDQAGRIISQESLTVGMTVLAIGQSNMAAWLQPAPIGKPPAITEADGAAGIGSTIFAKVFARYVGDVPMLFVNGAVGGTPLNGRGILPDWKAETPGSLYANAVDELRKAAGTDDAKPELVIWNQGETDAVLGLQRGETPAEVSALHEADLNFLIRRLERDFPGMQMIISGLGPPGTWNPIYHDAVRTAQKRTADALPKVDFAPTEIDLDLIDDIHVSAPSIAWIAAGVAHRAAVMLGLTGTTDARRALGSGADVFTGTSGSDMVRGGAGKDSIRGEGGDDILLGDGDADTVMGGSGDDVLSGGSGDDSVMGGTGNDVVFGDAGADTLFGDAGNDLLDGGLGSDRYVRSHADGNDTIQAVSDMSSVDVLVLRATRSDLPTLLRQGNDLVIELPALGTTPAARILLREHYGAGRIERIEFDDGIVWSGSDFQEVTGTVGNDRIGRRSTDDWIHAQAGNDSVLAGDGVDHIWGGIGNDTLAGEAGHDHFAGEEGSDSLLGGAGDDAYHWLRGHGDDTIIELAREGHDRLFFWGGVLPGEVTLTRVGLDVRLTIAAKDGVPGGSILLRNQTAGDWTGIEEIHFDDGTVWDWWKIRELASTIQGTTGNDRITGSTLPGWTDDWIFGGNGQDQIFGGAGRDVLNGGTGNDTIEGGTEDDRLIGAEGHDRFVFRPNHGRDTIADFAAGVGQGDVIEIGWATIRSFAALTAIAEDVGNDCVITFDAASSLTLLNVRKASLAADDFVFT